MCDVNCEGLSHSRTFFSRTNPAVAHETVERPAQLDTDKISVAAGSGENGTSAPQRSATSAGNYHRGGQSKRFTRDGRGRSNFHQQNSYRKPVAQSAGEYPPATSDEQQVSDVAGKTQQNSAGDSLPSSSESPSSRQDPPLPQRNHQRRSYAKDEPTASPAPTIESAETWLLLYIITVLYFCYVSVLCVTHNTSVYMLDSVQELPCSAVNSSGVT